MLVISSVLYAYGRLEVVTWTQAHELDPPPQV